MVNFCFMGCECENFWVVVVKVVFQTFKGGGVFGGGVHCLEEPKEFHRFVDVREAERVYRKFQSFSSAREKVLTGTWTLRKHASTCEWKCLQQVINCW